MKTIIQPQGKILALILFLFLLYSSSTAQPRVIEFSGFQWVVSDNLSTPSATNVYKSDPSMQFIDADGKLHLKLEKIFGVWYGSQIQMKESLGYGEYTFCIESDLSLMDDNSVLSLMLREDKNNNNIIEPTLGEGEIDILFSNWNGMSKQRGWYAIPPMPFECKWIYNCNKICPCVKSFNLPLTSTKKTTHKIIWNKLPEKGLYVYTQSYWGNYKDLSGSGYLIADNYFEGANIPIHHNEKVTINYWLFGNNVPASLNGATELEVIIKSVKYIPGKQKSTSRSYNKSHAPKKQKKMDSINSDGTSI